MVDSTYLSQGGPRGGCVMDLIDVVDTVVVTAPTDETVTQNTVVSATVQNSVFTVPTGLISLLILYRLMLKGYCHWQINCYGTLKANASFPASNVLVTSVTGNVVTESISCLLQVRGRNTSFFRVTTLL